MRITFEPPDQPEIVALIDELDAYQKPLYPPQSHHGVEIAALLQPDVLFAVARDDAGEASGCGAMLLTPNYGELKRLYVRPAARRGGTASALLRALETEAQHRGCRVFALETGVRQHAALAMYTRAGYRRCAPFGPYGEDPLSVFMRKGPPGPQLVIFDCDGVLVDSERLCNQAMADELALLGVELTLRETIDQFIGRSMPQCLQVVEGLLGAPPPADFGVRLAVRTRAALEHSLQPVEGVGAVLDGLVVPFCVASNGNLAKMHFTLGHTRLLPRFEGRLFSADGVARPKPAPDLFLHAARHFAADASRCVVVEDTPTGIAAARAAGMLTVGFAGLTPRASLVDAGAHQITDTMAQLPALLTRADLFDPLDRPAR
jgi:HAD superfamily hydrolase (TIGR01509 family)